MSQSLAEIDTTAMLERINATIKQLGTNENLAEFHQELVDQVAVQRARLAESILFETNMITAIENHFKAMAAAADTKRIPSDSFDIEYEQKTEKKIDAEGLYVTFATMLPASEYADAVFMVETFESNGTKLNKLARSYGESSPVAAAIKLHTELKKVGNPKLTIKRKENLKSLNEAA